jgi:hypothetical protein
MVKINFGSNIFVSQGDFTILGRGEKGGFIFGGFGNIANPLISVKVVEGVPFLNAKIYDSTPELVLQISDNVIQVNANNIYKMEVTPSSIEVINQNGETALDIHKENDIVSINMDLYDGNDHIVATSKGTWINPSQSFV